MITLEFENTFVIGTYVPNAGDKLKNIDAKKVRSLLQLAGVKLIV
jgi:exonuclease III